MEKAFDSITHKAVFESLAWSGQKLTMVSAITFATSMVESQLVLPSVKRGKADL